MAAATLAAARRAADEMVAAGVGRVLLFGSLARGDATARSDIDLVAIYDDLDYTERIACRGRLEALAWNAAGCSVDVYVTDAPEWAHRSEMVPCSLESRIAAEAVELADAGGHREIDWEKEIGLPADDTGELEFRLADMSDAVARLERNLRPAQAEDAAAADGDADEVAALENIRFAAAMGDIHMIVESAAKATHIANLKTAPVHSHSITKLLAPQPQRTRDAFVALVGRAVDLERLHLWRQGATYSADRPERRFDAETLSAHATAALGVARFVADECSGEGIPATALNRLKRRLDRAATLLTP